MRQTIIIGMLLLVGVVDLAMAGEGATAAPTLAANDWVEYRLTIPRAITPTTKEMSPTKDKEDALKKKKTVEESSTAPLVVLCRLVVVARDAETVDLTLSLIDDASGDAAASATTVRKKISLTGKFILSPLLGKLPVPTAAVDGRSAAKPPKFYPLRLADRELMVREEPRGKDTVWTHPQIPFRVAGIRTPGGFELRVTAFGRAQAEAERPDFPVASE